MNFYLIYLNYNSIYMNMYSSMGKAKKKKNKTKKSARPVPGDKEFRDKILSAAKKEFAAKGFHGASLKDIAHEVGVANSLVNYYFKNKEELFHSTIELFAKDRMEAIQRLLAEPKSLDELRVRLELFVEEMLLSYSCDPDSFEIINQEVKVQNAMVLKLFEETLLQSFYRARDFFKEAQVNQLIHERHDPLILAMLLFSTTCDTAQNDHLAKQFFNLTLTDQKWRKKVTTQIVDLFITGAIQ